MYSLRESACHLPRGIGVKPGNVLPQDGPVVAQSDPVDLLLCSGLEEPHFTHSGKHGPKRYPEKDIDLSIDFVDEEIVAEASGASAKQVLEHFVKSEIGARGTKGRVCVGESARAVHSIAATNQEREVIDEERVTSQ